MLSPLAEHQGRPASHLEFRLYSAEHKRRPSVHRPWPSRPRQDPQGSSVQRLKSLWLCPLALRSTRSEAHEPELVIKPVKLSVDPSEGERRLNSFRFVNAGDARGF